MTRAGARPGERGLRQGPVLIVLGDVSIDWFFFDMPHKRPQDERQAGSDRSPPDDPGRDEALGEGAHRWRDRRRVEAIAIHGGAWLLETFVKALLWREAESLPGMQPPAGPTTDKEVSGDGSAGSAASAPPAIGIERVFGYYRFERQYLRAAKPEILVHTVTEYQLFPRKKKENKPEDPKVYRCAGAARYWGQQDVTKQFNPRLKCLTVKADEEDAAYSRRFAQEEARWREAFQAACQNVLSHEETPAGAGAQAVPSQGNGAHASPGVPCPEAVHHLAVVGRPFPDADTQIYVIHDSADGFQRMSENWATLPFTRDPRAYPSAGRDGLPRRDCNQVIILYIQDVEKWKEELGKKPLRAEPGPGNAPWSGDEAGQERGLWTVLGQHFGRTVIVVSANALRRAGVNISKSLSWERTAHDFVTEVEESALLKDLSGCGHVVVRFGLSGIIHHSRRGTTLFYDPERIEGEYRDRAEEGDMIGHNLLLTATIATAAFRKFGQVAGAGRVDADQALADAVTEGVEQGFSNCRCYYRHGFTYQPQKPEELHAWIQQWDSPEGALHAPTSATAARRNLPEPIRIFEPKLKDGQLFKVPIKKTDPDWSILNTASGQDLLGIAKCIVCKGVRQTLQEAKFRFPIARFANLVTVDRKEIESFRSIRNLMTDYHARDTRRPLSIAVFGPPGSGKSFGVKQIAKSISDKESEPLECNLSQFSSAEDLSLALIWAREMALEQKVPLVFFDEFDAELNGVPLGWLKYFLSVMQDGKFKHGERMLSVGKAVFVFAGGTSTSYKVFCREGGKESSSVDKADKAEFLRAKGPDFVSRLRGYVNIIGPDRSPVYQDDEVFIIRRALLLRGQLEDSYRHLLQRGSEEPVSDSVLEALLQIDHYKHGARSMGALLEMSSLARAKRFDESCLPSQELLDMHVNGYEFLKLVLKPPPAPDELKARRK